MSQVADLISITLKRTPRLGEQGPLGRRPERRYDFGEQAGHSNLFVQVVAHNAAAAVPHSVLQYLRSGQVTTLAKPTGPPTCHFSAELLVNRSWLPKKRFGSQVCWRCKHHDQDHSVLCRGKSKTCPGCPSPQGGLPECLPTRHSTQN